MNFDDTLSVEQRDHVRALAVGLEELGFKEVRTITLLIAGRLLSIDPAWLARFGNSPSVELAFCLYLEVLVLAYVVPDGEALFIGGPRIRPQINENPDLIFSMLVPTDGSLHAVANA